MEKLKTIWSVGHSNKSLDEFISLLTNFKISVLVDIRSLPGSRHYPHFNKEFLEVQLPEKRIQYIHLKGLGGRRPVSKNSKNTGWRLPAFRGYADYMETSNFVESVKELENIAEKAPTAFMCSEVLWWRCHRSLVSDWLKFNGWKVYHIMGNKKMEEHHYTQPARISDGKLLYN
jgi:uncharacterized protein (DUF488 family)